MLHIQDYIITEAYTNKLVVSVADYTEPNVIYSAIVDRFGDMYKSVANFNERANKLSYIIYDYISKTDNTVILSGQDNNKVVQSSKESNYLKLNRSSFVKMKQLYDTENVIKIDGKSYSINLSDRVVSIGSDENKSITVAINGDGSDSLTTQQQENFVCTVINHILALDDINVDNLLEQYSKPTDLLSLVLSALNLEESSDIAKRIKNSNWCNSFLGTCKVILELLGGDCSDYCVKRIDDTKENKNDVVRAYLELVDVLRKPLNQNRNNVTTADILLYKKNEQQSVNLIKKITDSVQAQIKDNSTVDKTEKSDDQLKAIRKHIKEQLIDLWEKHKIVGISLKKTDKNASYEYCNFDANIDTNVVVSGYEIDVKKERTSIYINCDAKIVKDNVANTKDESGKVIESIGGDLSKELVSTDNEEDKKFALKGKTRITIRSLGNNNFGADITIGRAPTLGKVQANTYRSVFNKLINDKVDSTSKVQYSTIKNLMTDIKDNNTTELKDEFAKLIASGIKVNNFALPFILIK